MGNYCNVQKAQSNNQNGLICRDLCQWLIDHGSPETGPTMYSINGHSIKVLLHLWKQSKWFTAPNTISSQESIHRLDEREARSPWGSGLLHCQKLIFKNSFYQSKGLFVHLLKQSCTRKKRRNRDLNFSRITAIGSELMLIKPLDILTLLWSTSPSEWGILKPSNKWGFGLFHSRPSRFLNLSFSKVMLSAAENY